MQARRITGRHLLIDGPGAVIDVPAAEARRVLERARLGLRALEWPGEPAVRQHAKAVTVGIRAWPDVLGPATDLLEWAASEDDAEDLESIAARARRRENPRLRALLAAFPGLAFEGEGLLTLGLGLHSRSWPLEDLPLVHEVGEVRGVPRVTVTGTNGKTTTTRFLAHLATEAGHLVGRTSSDAVVIGEETVERGDWTGPGATRRVLRDHRVTFAALETARGGLLRRGLAVDGSDVAVLTNVAEEHLGEWGIDDLVDLARAKAVTAEGLKHGGVLIVPAGSPPIRRVVAEFSARRPDVRVWTYSARPVPGATAWADDRFLHFGDVMVPVAEVPITFSGTAKHNVENTLCATLAALGARVPGEAINRGLRTFRPSVGDNPGRMNTYRLPSGALVVLDFAHNAHGLERIVDTVSRWNKPRRVLLLGQAGDRPDVDLEALASAAVPLGAERIVLKDVTGRLYGRPQGQVPAILMRRLLADGVPAERITVTPDEVTGVRLALRGATHEHVIVALLHETLAAALQVVREAGGVSIDG